MTLFLRTAGQQQAERQQQEHQLLLHTIFFLSWQKVSDGLALQTQADLMGQGTDEFQRVFIGAGEDHGRRVVQQLR